MFRPILAASIFLLATGAGQPAMTDRTFLGDALDPRIARCGVTIDGDGLVTLRPFLDASADVAGSFRLLVRKHSAGGSSLTSQAGNFANGTLGNLVVMLNAPATMDLTMTLDDQRGAPLCRLEQRISL
jgi:hypothetical protein